jgi:hypothetical protein
MSTRHAEKYLFSMIFNNFILKLKEGNHVAVAIIDFLGFKSLTI